VDIERVCGEITDDGINVVADRVNAAGRKQEEQATSERDAEAHGPSKKRPGTGEMRTCTGSIGRAGALREEFPHGLEIPGSSRRRGEATGEESWEVCGNRPASGAASARRYKQAANAPFTGGLTSRRSPAAVSRALN
jgi:hypothetical protein